MEARFAALLDRFERGLDRLSLGTSSSGSDLEEAPKSPFDDFMEACFPPLLEAGEKLPEPIKKLTNMLYEVFLAEQQILKKTVVCAKPTNEELVALAQPVLQAIQAIGKIVPFKSDPLFNHGKSIEELASAAKWILVEKTPMDHVDNAWQLAEFYSLKVIRENRDTNKDHVVWAQALKKVGVDLLAFVKEYHRTGLFWKPKGIPLDKYSGAAPAPAAAPEKAQAPAASSSTHAEKPTPPAGGLFSELSKGEGITGMLRKVKPEEKTKNRPAEERVGTVPENIGAAKKEKEEKPVAGIAKPKVLPPVFRNVGTKLQIEHQVQNKTMTYESPSLQQTVYMYNCKNSLLKISGKVNSIVLDKCVRCGVVVDDVVSSVEIINGRDVDCQVINVCASIIIENTEGVKVYVSEAGMDKLEVYSSKSANILINAPGKRLDPDTKEEQEGIIEHALPSTLCSTFVNGKLDHTFVKHG